MPLAVLSEKWKFLPQSPRTIWFLPVPSLALQSILGAVLILAINSLFADVGQNPFCWLYQNPDYRRHGGRERKRKGPAALRKESSTSNFLRLFFFFFRKRGGGVQREKES